VQRLARGAPGPRHALALGLGVVHSEEEVQGYKV